MQVVVSCDGRPGRAAVGEVRLFEKLLDKCARTVWVLCSMCFETCARAACRLSGALFTQVHACPASVQRTLPLHDVCDGAQETLNQRVGPQLEHPSEGRPRRSARGRTLRPVYTPLLSTIAGHTGDHQPTRYADACASHTTTPQHTYLCRMNSNTLPLQNGEIRLRHCLAHRVSHCLMHHAPRSATRIRRYLVHKTA
jgi:hypothetical protein